MPFFSYTISILFWVILALLYRNGAAFSWRKYFLMLAGPALGLSLLVYYTGALPFYIFLSGLVVGPTLEWLLGFFYHAIMGRRLWFYERFAVRGGYTSYLTPAFWGFGFVLLWRLFYQIEMFMK